MNIRKIFKLVVSELAVVSPSPELDARVVIDFVLQKNDTFLLSHPDTPLTNAQYSRIRRLVNRRKKGEPIAYLTRHKEFYGLDFFVNKNVLIPRPESEELVSLALNRIRESVLGIKDESPLIRNTKYELLDMGTGSGCIIISIAKAINSLITNTSPLIRFHAADNSKKALAVAKKNAKRLVFEAEDRELSDSSRLRSNNNIRFFQSDLFSNPRLHKRFDLIIANLPYVPESRQETTDNRQSINYEPKEAIFANDNGASIIKRFIAQAKDRLTPAGAILLELDPRNAKEIQKYAGKVFPMAKIELKKDLAGLDRYLIIEM